MPARFRSVIKSVILPLIVLLGVTYSALGQDTLEAKVRLIGLALQLTGIIIATPGIIDLYRSAQHLLELLSRHRHYTLKIDSAEMKQSSGLVSLIRGAEPNAPVETHIAALEANVQALFRQTAAMQKQLDHHEHPEIEDERRVREGEVKDLRAEMRATALRVFVGAIFLSFGIVLSTASPEISRRLSALLRG